MSRGNQLQHGAQVLRDLWLVISLTEDLQLGDQLSNVTLMKDGDGFKTDETEVRKSGLVEIREKALDERVVITNDLQHPRGRWAWRAILPVHLFPEHVYRHDAA